MRVAILTPTLAKYDAVGNDVCGMYYFLKNRDIEVRLFANNSEVEDLDVRPYEEIVAYCDSTECLLIVHFSIGWNGYKLVSDLPCHKVLKYHNITPAHYFEGYSDDYATLCRAGREQLIEVCRYDIDIFMADSEFNKKELIEAGASSESAITVPPFHNINELETSDFDGDFLERFNDDCTNVLMVGRLAPNKGYRALIEAFAEYHWAYNPESRLLLAGSYDARLSRYRDELTTLIEERMVGHAVHFLGSITLQALKSAFLCADVFLTLSEHEGFCVPVVEAMALGVPVICLDSGAIGETVGDGGLVWEHTDPAYYAASVDEIVKDDNLRFQFLQSGRNNYLERFAIDAIENRFLRSLVGLGVV